MMLEHSDPRGALPPETLISAEVIARYQFLKHKDLELSGLLGLGYEHIEYHDNQLMPNELKLEISPMLRAGLELAF